MKIDKDKIIENGLKGLSVAAAIGLAVFLVKQFGDKAPVWAKSLIALVPGLGLSILSGNKYLIPAGIGMIGVGALIGAKQLTDGKGGILAQINAQIPALGEPGSVYQPAQVVDTTFQTGVSGLGQPDQLFLS